MANYLLEALKRQKLAQMSHQPQPLPPDLLGALADAEGTLYDKSMIYKALKDAVTAPGRAYRGEIDALGDPRGAMEEAMNTAGMAQLGGIPGGAKGPGSVGMITYHGSPHKFDKFDMSKIGTGEGAQAYGHGLYFAEAPEVAQTYGRSTTPGNRSFNSVDYNGQKFPAGSRDGELLYDITTKGRADVIRNLQSQADRLATINPKESANLLSRIEYAKTVQPDAVRIDAGNLYKVDIPDESVARMLDWDKPLSMQSPEVRKAFGKLVGRDINHETGWAKLTGEEALKAAQERAGWAGKGSGESLLRQQGIPGIRYLDGGSRTAGDGTSNFVLFDDQLPRILERNGEATGMQPWQPGEANALLGIPSSAVREPTAAYNVNGQSMPEGWLSGWETRIDQPYLEGPPAPKRPRDTWGGYGTPEEYQAAQAAKQIADAEWSARTSQAQRDILNGATRSQYQNGDPAYRVYDRIAQDVPPYLNNRPRNALNQEIPPTQYELAHQTAQRNAALPVDQGGLGLPEGNTAMDRARAMGFDTDAYHGSPTGRIRKFGLSRFNGESSFNSFAPDVNVANEYVTGAADWPQIGMKKIIDYNGTIYPVKLNRRNAANPKDVGRIAKKAIDNDEYIGELSDIEQYMPLGKDDEIRHWRYVEDQNLLRKIKNEGYTGFETTENRDKGFKDKYIAYGVNDPTTIRSRFAAFDPARRDSADLLATLAPYAIASPLLAGNLYDYLSQE